MLWSAMNRLKRNSKGFSLVELMVAVTILALFAVGIISAFSGAFQAMADSKYRTIATNLAQKELEKVKNTKDVEYPFFQQNKTVINGIEYTVNVVADERDDENVADVIATVSWYNRENIQKDVRLQTIIYNLKTKIEELPVLGKIELYADPTMMICCQDDQISTVTAEAFDENNERLVPSGTPISFVTNDEGELKKDYALTDTAGRAVTEMTIKSLKSATVQARAGSTFSNIVTVSCVPVPYEINLSTSASTVFPGQNATIKAVVTDSCGKNLDKDKGEVVVVFETDSGYFDGSPAVKTKNVPTINGIAEVVLTMVDSGDNALITGTVFPEDGDLFEVPLTDSVEVFCTDYSIKIETEKESVFPNDQTKITATLFQVGGVIPSNETIFFTTNIGNLSDATQVTDLNGEASVYLSGVPGGTIATVTAEYKIPNTNNSIYDSVQVKSVQFIVTIKAEPDKIIPSATSLITATLTDYLGNPATDYLVKFFTTKGSLTDYSVYTNSSGVAQTTLSGLKSGNKAEITVTFGDSGDISDTTTVDCINYILTASANPTNILAGKKSTITFNLKNASGTAQRNKTIYFTTTSGSLNRTSAQTNTSGNVTVELTMNHKGIATVTGTFTEGDTTVEASVEITCTDTYLTLVSHSVARTGSSGSSPYDILNIEIKLNGGPLTIDSVLANWTLVSSTPVRYEYIRITSPLNGTETEVYNRSVNNRNIKQNLDSNFTITKDTTFRIKMRFSSGINSTNRNKRTFDLTLNPDDPNSDYYKVSFTTQTK